MKTLPNFHSKSLPPIDTAYSSFNVTKFNEPKPVRDYERFIPVYTAQSGINHSKKYQEFMNKDIVQPLHKERNLLYPSVNYDYSSRQCKWSLNHNAICPSEPPLPKQQPFKEYNFAKRDKETTDKYRSTFLTTDHVAIKVPNFKTIQHEEFLKLKGMYNILTESDSGWSPRSYSKSVNNKSSVNYNIISCEGNCGTGGNTANILEKKLINKKKAIGEYDDLTRTFSINYSDKFTKAYNDNEKRFYHYNGVFTRLYDAAFRNGNIIMPFRKNNEPKFANREPWGYKKKNS